MRKSLIAFNVLIFALLCANHTQAQIRYKVIIAAGDSLLQVEMQFRASAATTNLQMPSWSPGIYVLNNAWSALEDLSVTDASGHTLTLSHPASDTWTFSTRAQQQITVHYQIPAGNAADAASVHYGAPAIYLYIAGRKSENCLLEFDLPADWKIATGLEERPTQNGQRVFFANNYDELLDNPVSMGRYKERHYKVLAKDHTVVFRGPGADWVDYTQTVNMTRFVSQFESDFFGESLPYKKYVWHFWVYESASLAGGTEHAGSTDMHLTTEEGPEALQGMAHEYFHLWNVKRIRPKPLGPFDYRRLPKTGSLWWSEGVTDYYSMLLPYRYGAFDRAFFLRRVWNELQDVRGNPARLEVSPYDASYRITPESGNYYKVNYYPTGWVLGMLFDIELRSVTHGKHSLDDVMLALWKQCRDGQPGFADNAIRQLLVRYGGAHMGMLYDQWVLRPGELPIDQELAKAGLMIRSDRIVALPGITSDQQYLQSRWLRSQVKLGIIPPVRETSLPVVKGDTSLFKDFSGRYELAEDVMLEVIRHQNGLFAGLSGEDPTALEQRSDSTFFYPFRNAVLNFSGNGINWQQNGHIKYIQRIGPLVRDLQKTQDPDPGLTLQIRSALNALGDGINANTRVTGLAPQMQREYIVNGPVRDLAGLKIMDYLYSETVKGPSFNRHGAAVSRILYYKLVTNMENTYVMVYLTKDNELTDYDYVNH